MDNQLNKKNRMTKKDEKDTRRSDKESRREKKGASRALRKKRSSRDDDDEDDEDVDSRGNIRGLIDYSDSEEEASDGEDSPPRNSRGFKPRKAAVKAREKITKKLYKEEDKKKKRSASRRVIESDTEEDDDYDEDDEEEDETPTTTTKISNEDDEDDDEDDDDDDDEEETEEDAEIRRGNKIMLNFGFGEEPTEDWTIPKRYKIKKESEVVQKFYKLMTTPIETDTIDDHIDQFKSLKVDEQTRMITALEARPKAKDQPVMFKILNMKTTPEIQAQLMSKYNALQSIDPASGEYYKMRNWLEKATAVPLGIRKEMPIKIEDGPEVCQGFMTRAKKCLDEAIYGQEEAKLQILQFIASKITNPQARGMSLLLVGPPGIGKTSLIKQGIAKALDWPFQFISLGGDSDASTFSGHQMVYEGSHCGKIVNSLVSAKSMSMVLMFDELDKISATPKGEEIQNLLVHLTDPTQNSDFEDKYLAGIPLDLSQSLFVFSGNDINKIDKILLDRFTVVHLEGYGMKEKMEIAEKFLLPGALREVNLAERIGIPKDVVNHIMETYAKEEPGVRELKRCMEQIAQKINMLRLFNSPDLPFYIKDFSLPFILKKEHIDKFLKERKPSRDVSALAMYT
jgi:ATP-dependent Lon protease